MSGVRRIDVLMVIVLCGFGVALMILNVRTDPMQAAQQWQDRQLWHLPDPASWWSVPAIVLVALPFLWWRRSVLLVALASTGLMLVHVGLFGWTGRCGFGLPLAVLLTYLSAVRYERRRAALGSAAATLMVFATLVKDSTAGWGALPIAAGAALAVFALGRSVRSQGRAAQLLRDRNDELAALQQARAALEVDLDRTRVRGEFERLLPGRLEAIRAQAHAAAEGPSQDLESSLRNLELAGRQTLASMREVVGVLRPGDLLGYAPYPGINSLPQADGVRVQVVGVPRILPTSVELCAVRIIDHFTQLCTQRAGAEVDIEFADNQVTVRIRGDAHRRGDVRIATARARERARLHRGSVEVRTGKHDFDAAVLLPG